MAGYQYGGSAGAQYGGSQGALWGLPLLFPPLDVTATNITQTAADIDWTDNNPDEYAFGIQHSKWYPDIEEWGPWREVTEVPQNAESATDDTVQPSRTYRWRVYASNVAGRAYSDVVEDETVDSGVRQTNVATTGYYVEVEHPDRAAPLKPEVLEGAQRKPTINDLPEASIPVAYDERWQSEKLDQAPMRVWIDGERAPIEELERVRMETQGSTKRTVLEGRGGMELLDRVDREVEFASAHEVAEDIITNNTSYTANVDDPSTSVDENVPLGVIDSTGDLESNLPSFDEDSPLFIDNGTVQTEQTAWFAEAEGNENTGTINFDHPEWSGDAVVEWDQSGQLTLVEVTFDIGRAIPSDGVGMAFRLQLQDDGHDGMTIQLDGDTVQRVSADALSTNESSPDWNDFALNVNQDLSPGQHTVTFWYSGEETPLTQAQQDERDDQGESWDNPYVSDHSNITVYIDCLSLYDDRFDPGFTENVDSGNVLEGPDLHPEVPLTTGDVSTPFSIVGGRVEIDIDGSGTSPLLELSNDQGSTWPIDAQDTDAVEGDFQDGSPQLRARITISGYDDDPNTSPAGRSTSQALDAFEFFGDLDDTPTLANRGFDGRAIDVLTQIADDRNFVFEIQSSADGELSVEWTQPGQRTSDVNPDVVGFELDKQTEDLVEQMTIFGSPQWRRGEAAPLSGEDWEPLQESNLVELSESVVDPSDDSQYARGEDYEMHYLSGEIRRLSTGEIGDGDTVEVDYQYRTQGTWPADDAVDDPRQDVETIIGLGTARICEQAALFIVERASDPIWEGTMTITRDNIGWSAIDEINPPDVPTRGIALQTRSIEADDESITVSLASRRTVGEIIDTLNQRMSQLSERA